MLRNLREDKESEEPVTDETIQAKKQEVLRDLIQEEVFTQLAKQYGIAISDSELAADIQRYPAFQKDGRFDQTAYFQTLYFGLRTTPEDFERRFLDYKVKEDKKRLLNQIRALKKKKKESRDSVEILRRLRGYTT